jgi:putative endonuclease
MSLWARIKLTFKRRHLPRHLLHGQLGELTARLHLQKSGLHFLTANFRCRHGEVDLICRDHDCLVFVEVKTRSIGQWSRPADAVNLKRQRRLSRAALSYLAQINLPQTKIRFDIVEIFLANHQIQKIQHLPNAFPLSPPYRYP